MLHGFRNVFHLGVEVNEKKFHPIKSIEYFVKNFIVSHFKILMNINVDTVYEWIPFPMNT